MAFHPTDDPEIATRDARECAKALNLILEGGGDDVRIVGLLLADPRSAVRP